MRTGDVMNTKWSVLALVVTLAACSSKGQVRDDTFPDPARAYPAGGTYVNLDNLRQYAPGMSKQQLQSLLGTPHFNEGLWGVREWNYLFNFRGSVGATPIQCQFQVRFGDGGVSTGQSWKPESCAALLQPAPAPAPPPPPPVAETPLRISADALFAFDSATLADAGKARLTEVVRSLGPRVNEVNLVVVGYTDRIGSDAYNLGLSQRRAATVREYLVQQGVPAGSIRAEGRGSTEPLVECDGSNGAALLTCLAPNRRVEISGIGG